MIIGRDLLYELGIFIDLLTETVHWNDAIIPMKTSKAIPIKSFHINDPKGVDKVIDQILG